MIRGTTAQFKFKLPYAIGDLQWVVMQFWQPGNKGTPDAPLPIVKKKTELFGDSKELLVSLTSHETLRFTDKLKARVQLRAQHSNGTVFASRQELVTVYPLSDNLIITEGDDYGDGWIVLDGDSVAQSSGELTVLDGASVTQYNGEWKVLDGDVVMKYGNESIFFDGSAVVQ